MNVKIIFAYGVMWVGKTSYVLGEIKRYVLASPKNSILIHNLPAKNISEHRAVKKRIDELSVIDKLELHNIGDITSAKRHQDQYSQSVIEEVEKYAAENADKTIYLFIDDMHLYEMFTRDGDAHRATHQAFLAHVDNDSNIVPCLTYVMYNALGYPYDISNTVTYRPYNTNIDNERMICVMIGDKMFLRPMSKHLKRIDTMQCTNCKHQVRRFLQTAILRSCRDKVTYFSVNKVPHVFGQREYFGTLCYRCLLENANPGDAVIKQQPLAPLLGVSVFETE